MAYRFKVFGHFKSGDCYPRNSYQGRVSSCGINTPRNSFITFSHCAQLEYFVHRQKYLELLSWQGGGEQRMAFPPWKPNTASSDIASMDSCGKTENEVECNIEMAILVKELNTLKTLCTAAVSHYAL